MNQNLVSVSKFLSLVLRHKPEEVGLCLDTNGWASISDLILCADQNGIKLSHELIEKVVANNDKSRFVIDQTGSKIRANQGHSISIDLELPPQEPPSILFHGTATRFVESIRQQGILNGNRRHVHLSSEASVATSVGARHGKPLVLQISAKKMYTQNYHFYLSQNGVWLTEHVPVSFIEFPTIVGE